MKNFLLFLCCIMLCSCTTYVRDFELLPGDKLNNSGVKTVKDKLILETPLDTTNTVIDTNRVILYNENYSKYIILTGVNKGVDSLIFDSLQIGNILK